MRQALFALTAIVLLKTALVLVVIFTAGIGLGPDEAQYWTWSRHLSFGYYSKPPGIAWQIKLGTLLFGDTELGVRFFSLIIGGAISYVLFFIAKASSMSAKTCFWAGTIFATAPLGIIGSLFAITDLGMIFFFSLACFFFVRNPKDDLYMGAAILLGALFKWPIYLFWIFPLLFRVFTFRAFILSLLGSCPSIWWNASHNWVTFRHVAATLIGGHGKESGTTELFHGNFFDFLGAQAALLSPLYFLLFLCAILYFARHKTEHRFLAAAGFLPLAVYSIISLFMKMQGNWCVFTYPTAIVYIAWVFSSRQLLLIISAAFSSFLTCTALLIPTLQQHYPIPYRINPFRHNVGWDKLQETTDSLPAVDFFFSDKYQTTSILSFYNKEKEPAYFLNLQGARHNQFMFWPSMEVGKTGYFALVENTTGLIQQAEHYKMMLKPYFQNVQIVGVYPLFFVMGTPVKEMLIIECQEYNGKETNTSNRF